ncbi:hypothetical protein [Mesorhizobium atlanticum]|uniref:hypothetical protein n=1 Tax=Mesorhizobium atlanticum TaxID=2233532 RepID=UPI003CCAA7EA
MSNASVQCRSVLGWPGSGSEQAGRQPISDSMEMVTTPGHAVEELKGIPGYVDAFGKAFLMKSIPSDMTTSPELSQRSTPR